MHYSLFSALKVRQVLHMNYAVAIFQNGAFVRDEFELCGIEITKERVAGKCRLLEKQNAMAQKICLFLRVFARDHRETSQLSLLWGAEDFKTRNARNYVCAVAFQMQYLQGYGWKCCEGIKTSIIFNEELQHLLLLLFSKNTLAAPDDLCALLLQNRSHHDYASQNPPPKT
jgi:hypothetical protein